MTAHADLARRQPLVPSPVLAMMIFIFTEIMFFCALISAFIVLRGQASVWPPLDQPRLPVWGTGVISIALLYSGKTMLRGTQSLATGDVPRAERLVKLTFALGTLFVLLQGAEWVALVRYGLTSSSSLYGSLFYTLVGCHALHVIAALGGLLYIIRGFSLGRYTVEQHDGVRAMRMFWIFVVAVWPPLYGLVYLW